MKSVFFLVSIFLASCSKPQYGEPISITNEGGKTTYAFASETEAVNAAAQYTLLCVTPGSCPENVGTLIYSAPHTLEISVCTFSIVADDIAITNRHCIVAEFAHRGASCAGRVQFLLLKHGSSNKSDIFECDTVLSVPNEYVEGAEHQRDYAVLKMKRTRPAFATKDPRILPFGIDAAGISPGQSFHVIVTDPNQDRKLVSTIREQTCVADANPFIYDVYAVATDPVVSFSNCKIIHGNSGSPILDSSYRLRGVINEFVDKVKLDPDFEAEIAEGGDPRYFAHINQYRNALDVAGGINLSCVDSPELGLKMFSATGCKVVNGKNSQQSADLMIQPEFLKNESAAMNADLPKIAQAAPVFQWTWSEPNGANVNELGSVHRMINQFSPRCFDGIYDNFKWRELVSAPDTNGYSTYIVQNIPLYMVDSDVDATLKVFLVYTTKLQHIIFKFNLNELVSSPTHTTNLNIERSGYVVTKSTVSTQSIGFCMYYMAVPATPPATPVAAH